VLEATMTKLGLSLLLVLFLPLLVFGNEPLISVDTETCLDCHSGVFPGIFFDWKNSRMAKITPGEALKKPERQRRVSFKKLPEGLMKVVVGCAECHTMNPDKHPDSFEHNGYKVHTVVTPEDCRNCHPTEDAQYKENLMSHAYGNLQNNDVFRDLAATINGIQVLENSQIVLKKPHPETEAESCLHCHGTKVYVKGYEDRETDYEEMRFPVLSGWPNQGVGRINPDGSKGACTACHTRHRFAIEMARKPHTCSQCHKGPDVPAYKIYDVSKHGNIYSAMGKDKNWNFAAVPWTVGKDFSAPTCAVCHMSLIQSEENGVVAERTHKVNDRLYWRLFGLIYAHPHPRSPDTTLIRNSSGLPLPTDFSGKPAVDYLIDVKEQQKRKTTMQNLCLACHSRKWVEHHFDRLEQTIQMTDKMTLTATQILQSAWDSGSAAGLEVKGSIFDEGIEKKWVTQWLFYANTTRMASAMVGADYGVFAHGRWNMAENIQDLRDRLRVLQESNKSKE